MRIANLSGRLVVLRDGLAFDVELASDGEFGSDPRAVYERWEEFRAWGAAEAAAGGQARAAEAAGGRAAAPYDPIALDAPVPRPRQVFALGLNYAMHAREAGHELPPMPLAFTKFPSCLTGPGAVVDVATEYVDWEVELVVVIGRRAHRVDGADAWDHVAGLTVGQDLSARDVQMRGSPPRFSLIGCAVNGEQVQSDRTSSMLFGVGEIVARLSAICPLLPGDLIFTGTPAGVGNQMDPPRYLRPGDELVSIIEGIGTLTTRFA